MQNSHDSGTKDTYGLPTEEKQDQLDSKFIDGIYVNEILKDENKDISSFPDVQTATHSMISQAELALNTLLQPQRPKCIANQFQPSSLFLNAVSPSQYHLVIKPKSTQTRSNNLPFNKTSIQQKPQNQLINQRFRSTQRSPNTRQNLHKHKEIYAEQALSNAINLRGAFSQARGASSSSRGRTMKNSKMLSQHDFNRRNNLYSVGSRPISSQFTNCRRKLLQNTNHRSALLCKYLQQRSAKGVQTLCQVNHEQLAKVFIGNKFDFETQNYTKSGDTCQKKQQFRTISVPQHVPLINQELADKNKNNSVAHLNIIQRASQPEEFSDGCSLHSKRLVSKGVLVQSETDFPQVHFEGGLLKGRSQIMASSQSNSDDIDAEYQHKSFKQDAQDSNEVSKSGVDILKMKNTTLKKPTTVYAIHPEQHMLLQKCSNFVPTDPVHEKSNSIHSMSLQHQKSQQNEISVGRLTSLQPSSFGIKDAKLSYKLTPAEGQQADAKNQHMIQFDHNKSELVDNTNYKYNSAPLKLIIQTSKSPQRQVTKFSQLMAEQNVVQGSSNNLQMTDDPKQDNTQSQEKLPSENLTFNRTIRTKMVTDLTIKSYTGDTNFSKTLVLDSNPRNLIRHQSNSSTQRSLNKDQTQIASVTSIGNATVLQTERHMQSLHQDKNPQIFKQPQAIGQIKLRNFNQMKQKTAVYATDNVSKIFTEATSKLERSNNRDIEKVADMNQAPSKKSTKPDLLQSIGLYHNKQTFLSVRSKTQKNFSQQQGKARGEENFMKDKIKSMEEQRGSDFGSTLAQPWGHKQFFTSHIMKLRQKRLSMAEKKRRVSIGQKQYAKIQPQSPSRDINSEKKKFFIVAQSETQSYQTKNHQLSNDATLRSPDFFSHRIIESDRNDQFDSLIDQREKSLIKNRQWSNSRHQRNSFIPKLGFHNKNHSLQPTKLIQKSKQNSLTITQASIKRHLYQQSPRQFQNDHGVKTQQASPSDQTESNRIQFFEETSMVQKKNENQQPQQDNRLKTEIKNLQVNKKMPFQLRRATETKLQIDKSQSTNEGDYIDQMQTKTYKRNENKGRQNTTEQSTQLDLRTLNLHVNSKTKTNSKYSCPVQSTQKRQQNLARRNSSHKTRQIVPNVGSRKMNLKLQESARNNHLSIFSQDLASVQGVGDTNSGTTETARLGSISCQAHLNSSENTFGGNQNHHNDTAHLTSDSICQNSKNNITSAKKPFLNLEESKTINFFDSGASQCFKNIDKAANGTPSPKNFQVQNDFSHPSDQARLVQILNQIIEDQKYKREDRSLLRKLVDEQSQVLKHQAYKSFFANRPKMQIQRDQQLKDLLKGLNGRSNRMRRRLVPQLQQFTRNLREFKYSTHSQLKGETQLQHKLQLNSKNKMSQLMNQNMNMFNKYNEQIQNKQQDKSFLVSRPVLSRRKSECASINTKTMIDNSKCSSTNSNEDQVSISNYQFQKVMISSTSDEELSYEAPKLATPVQHDDEINYFSKTSVR